MNEKIIDDFSVEFWKFMPQFHRFMHHYYNRHSNFQLNKNQKKALMVIYHHGEMYMSKLGECIGLQKGSLTTLIDSLEKENYIKRQQADKDRRKTVLSLTKKAHNIIKNRKKEMKKYINQTFKNISNHEINELIKSFKQITKIMKKL